MDRKIWKTRAILAASLLVVASAVVVAKGRGRRSLESLPQEVMAQAPVAPPVVEIVFAIDTTGSMSGLLEGAKQTVWQIASKVASGQPRPVLRVGLVAYRDKGDDYVTKVFPMTGDLDAVYQELMSYAAGGGGDGPEHVNKAIDDAMHQMAWSPGAMKMIFVVGDAPPHDDYQDGLESRALARQAFGKQITLHTVRCGAQPQTGEIFTELAQLGGGKYQSIAQDGGVVAVATPVDGKLAELNRRLNSFNMIYGDEVDHRRFAGKMGLAAAAPASTAADRSSFYARSGAKMDDKDILGDVASGAVDVGGLDDAKLPEGMRGLSTAEKKARATKMASERREVQKEIEALARERDGYLKARKPAGGFDGAVEEAIKTDGAKHGIKF